MRLPSIEQPSRYRGLYIFDFGDWSAVGYTADEVSMLLESEQYRSGKVYRIVRATPDGRFELRGVPVARFQLESGMFFNRGAEAAARQDFEELAALGERTPPPVRAFLHLAQRRGLDGQVQWVTALIYPAEHEDDMARWLIDARYAGGDTAEGGISHVTNYYGEPVQILERRQLWSGATQSRSREEVLATVRRAVQR